MRLKEIRKEKKLSQYKVSELTGVSQNYISNLESKKHEATESIIIQLCRGLKIDPNTLLGWDELLN